MSRRLIWLKENELHRLMSRLNSMNCPNSLSCPATYVQVSYMLNFRGEISPEVSLCSRVLKIVLKKGIIYTFCSLLRHSLNIFFKNFESPTHVVSRLIEKNESTRLFFSFFQENLDFESTHDSKSRDISTTYIPELEIGSMDVSIDSSFAPAANANSAECER